MERLICVLVGYVFGLIQTGYIYGKRMALTLEKGERECRNNECTSYYGLESRSGHTAWRLL